ncbi:MAG: hypothetical protein ABIB79_03120 [archaeon]
MKKILIIIVIALVVILSIFLYMKLNAPFLKHRGGTSIIGITLDGKDVLLSRQVDRPSNCGLYLKEIQTKKETSLGNFISGGCGIEEIFSLSKNRKNLFIISDVPLTGDEISTSEYNLKQDYSIYVQNIINDEITLIKEGLQERTTEDYDYYTTITTSYSLIRPSPINDNEFLFTKEENIIKDAVEGKTYSYKVGSWFYNLDTQKEILVYEEELEGESWNWPESRYQPLLTRWSPDGKAIIYEIGYLPRVGEGGSKYSSNYNNEAYIFYLDNLNPLEFKPENVRDDINKCGYYYNNMPKYSSPDGKTYIRSKSRCIMDDCTYYYYIEEGEPYCQSII